MMRLAAAIAVITTFVLDFAQAQEYAGDFINTTLPAVPGLSWRSGKYRRT